MKYEEKSNYCIIVALNLVKHVQILLANSDAIPAVIIPKLWLFY